MLLTMIFFVADSGVKIFVYRGEIVVHPLYMLDMVVSAIDMSWAWYFANRVSNR